jgi:hypothetical protein
MANPTTNYGFVLPTSTDLVTDLPADFDVALQGVDTRLKALQPGTTTGDLVYSSATANTNTRLGIGSTGEVLTVAGGVPTWAAAGAAATSFSLLNAGGTALSGANIRTISGISGQQKLLIFIVGGTTASGSQVNFGFRLNGDSSSLYDTAGLTLNPTSSYAPIQFISYSLFEFDEIRMGTTAYSATSTMGGSLLIDGANGTGFKTYTGSGGATTGGDNSQIIRTFQGVYKGTSTISSVSFFTGGTNFNGGTIYVYGSAN